MKRAKILLLILSFFLAFMLSIVSLPQKLQWIWPNWVALVLIYWFLRDSDQIGFAFAFIIGLLSDSLLSTPLGLHALGYSFIAYCCIKLSRRLNIFPFWQQSILVFIILGIYQLIHLWALALLNQAPFSLAYWLPVITGALLWPLVHAVITFGELRLKIR